MNPSRTIKLVALPLMLATAQLSASSAHAATPAKPAFKPVPNWIFRLGPKAHRPTEILRFANWQAAKGQLRPGDTVVASTWLKLLPGAPKVPGGHYGLVQPDGKIFHYHGRVFSGRSVEGIQIPGYEQVGGKPVMGSFLREGLEDFANGRNPDGTLAKQDRPIVVLRYNFKPEQQALFGSQESFDGRAKDIEQLVQRRQDGEFNVLGKNSCRNVAKQFIFGAPFGRLVLNPPGF